MKKFTLATLLLYTVFSFSSFSQVAGDFGSRVPVGNWSLVGTWGIWNGSDFTTVPAAGLPTAADNVWIANGTTVTLDVSPKDCKNLDVQSTGKLWTNDGTLNGNRYVTVWGTSLVCDGTIGNGAIYDNISFNIDGTSCTISGTGTFDASRIRKEFITNATTNLTINMNVNLRFNGTSLTQIYNDASSTNFNVTISSGSTLTCVAGNASIAGIIGLDVNKGGSYNVNGIMDVQGSTNMFCQNNSLTAYCTKWIVNSGGELKVNAANCGTGSGSAKDSLIVNSGGKFNLTGTSAFSSPPNTVNNAYIFNEGSTVEYSASGNQAIQNSTAFGGAPINQYYNLIISGSGSKGLIGTTGVRNDITIDNTSGLNPALTALAWNINIGGNWTNYLGGTGFTYTAGSNQLITFFTNPLTGANVNQSITCPGGEIFNAMTINKTTASAIGKYVQLNNNLTVHKTLQFSSTDFSCMVLNGHTLSITNLNNTLTPWNGITASAIGLTANTVRQVISETEVLNAGLATNPSIIKWKMDSASNSPAHCYVFPFGVSTSTSIPIPVTIGKKNTISATVSIATRHSSNTDNTSWDDATSVAAVSSMPSLFVGPNPASDSNTVDRWWEIGASPSPMLVDSIQFSYQGSENTLQPTYRNLPIKAQDWTGTGWAKGITTPCAYCYSGVSAAGTIGIAVLRTDTIGVYQPWVLTSVSHPLPIKLLYFTAELKGGKVDVNWATASEINNEIFYVERSKDGQVFEDVGSRPGANNSTMTIYYNLVDPEPYAGLSYYRLRQKDYDGKISYSEMVSILNKDRASAWYVFPNPATTMIKIASSGSDELQNATFGLYSPEGTLVRTISLDAKNQSVVELDIHDLSNGVYFGRISNEYNQQVFKIIKN